MINITAEQWDTYVKKYGKLMWRISHLISGDSMLASVEDNYSDLTIAAMESINGFHKKTSKSVDEMFSMKLFDQYTKTCLWTAKARKGIRLTERMPFRNKHMSLDELRSSKSEESIPFDVPDTSALARFARVEANDSYINYEDDVKKLIDTLEQNPGFMTESGDIKIEPLAKALNMPAKKIKKLIKITEVKNDPNR